MKISFRILLINFVIVVLIFASSTLVFYSLTKKLISLQHSKTLLNSANDFVFDFQSSIQEMDEEFLRLKTVSNFQKPVDLDDKKIDFLFKQNGDDEIIPDYYFVKSTIIFDSKFSSLANFISKNPNSIIKSFNLGGGQKIIYGKSISKEFLDNLSKRIRAEVAIVLNNIPLEVSNQTENEKYYVNIINASRELNNKTNFEITKEELEGADFYAVSYLSNDFYLANSNIKFLVFSKLPEAAELRSNINSLLIIIGLPGVALSLILVMLFTGKLRKQIGQLSETAEKIRSGDIKRRVNIKSKDELGKLSNAFNNMLDELERKENALNEYSEFITLINQNPTLVEVSDAALTKIIKSIEFSAGRLSLVVDRKVKTISSYGVQKELIKDEDNIDLYQRAIEKGETVEFRFDENLPKLSSGLLSLDIKYILIFPILYNRKVIAILELASISNPKDNVKEYLENIKEQLAVGLSNSSAFHQLENFVNELKKLNEEYQKQNEQISEQNQKLVELHKQLSEKAEELNIQKEKAIESSVLKSQFLANMSHELKTPLNSILGLSELILNDKSLSSANREKLVVILRNGNRLINLINDILSFSKIEAGKMQIEPEDFCFKDLIDEVESQIIPLTRNKALNFVIHNELNTSIVLNADRKKISQILLNLLSNSVKFSDKGIIVLKSKLLNEDKIQFEVIDSGIGISQENLQVIFEEFRQIDGSSTRKYNGTGLGLAICKKFAEILEGELVCESEVGKGSIFKLTIPIKLVAIKKLETNLNLFEEKYSGTILIIDDIKENRSFIGEYLSSKKYEIMFADSGEKAAEHCTNKRPYAIVLNLLNQKENSWAILNQLISNKLTEQIPIITYAILEEAKIGYGFNVFEYFQKPLLQEKILSSITKYENLSSRKIEKVVIVDDDSFETRELKNQMVGKNIKLNFLPSDFKSESSLAQLHPDYIVINLTSPSSDGFNLLYSIKESPLLRAIPVSVSVSDQLTKEDVIRLSYGVKKTVTSAKNYPLDVLKVIRDRLHLEEGLPDVDTSAIWIESQPDFSNSDRASLKPALDKKKNLILIVDDDADTLFTVGEIVKETGCDIAFAKNGLECLSALSAIKPGLILLDIMMPLMDGFETIKRIRSDLNYKSIPVFALTAKAMLGDKEIVMRNGFDDLILKPVNSVDLANKIGKLLFHRSGLMVHLDS
ncbi:MAG: response regulator [Ignavibacteriales bacterium]|nr:response regulator [Ignavibacteriales bacterium]